ncbi:hypothetical protein [Paenibacillus macerans]|uniref:hypothetical protein n=1 Tax=Paenibacillus macerans TaxID=44252 RepID=UPI00242C45AD|nr:hypothetical protein [Paenibacillus macerans]
MAGAKQGGDAANHTDQPFVIELLFKVTGKAGGRGKTVDLSHGRRPEPGGRHVKKAYCFSPEETREILRQCKSEKMTLSEFICCRLTDGLLQHAPGKRLVQSGSYQGTDDGGMVDSRYFSIKNQSLLLTMATLSGRLMAEVSVLENLYDTEEVFGLFDQILAVENLLPAKRPELAAQEPAAVSLSPS